jgi:glyoxylase-like metal-dependent hydrolase (beta-lactamase superfamily II)
MKLTERIYAYPWTNMMENNCNSYIFKGERLILIDPGLKKYVPALLISVQNDGLNPDDIDLIINTHSHPDHLDGDAYFMDRQLQMTMHEDEEKFLNSIGKEFFGMFGLEPPSYRVDFYIKEGEFSHNDLTLQVLDTPGHSPGSVSLYWPEEKALISGDVVFSGSVGRTDFPGGDGATLKKSIEKISGLDVEYLLPGHNEIVRDSDVVKKNFDFIKNHFFSYL